MTAGGVGHLAGDTQAVPCDSARELFRLGWGRREVIEEGDGAVKGTSARPARCDVPAGRRAGRADEQAGQDAKQESDDMRQVGHRSGARGGIAG